MTDNFGLRLRSLIERKGLTVDAFADSFGIARSTAHLWLKRSMPPLEKHWRPLADFFGVSEKYIVRGVPEPEIKPEDYRNSGIRENGPGDEVHSRSAAMLDPRFQPRAEPTLQMCKDYIEEYLRRADAQPGGIGYAWVKLQKQFPLDEFEPVELPDQK